MPIQVSQFNFTVSGAVLTMSPTVPISSLHTLTDEGMAAPPATRRADWFLISAGGMGFRMRINPATVDPLMDTVSSIKVGFDHLGTILTGNPSADVYLYAGTPLAQIATFFVDLDTSNTAKQSQIEFPLGPAISRADYVTLECEFDYRDPGAGGTPPPDWEQG